MGQFSVVPAQNNLSIDTEMVEKRKGVRYNNNAYLCRNVVRKEDSHKQALTKAINLKGAR